MALPIKRAISFYHRIARRRIDAAWLPLLIICCLPNGYAVTPPHLPDAEIASPKLEIKPNDFDIDTIFMFCFTDCKSTRHILEPQSKIIEASVHFDVCKNIVMKSIAGESISRSEASAGS